MLVVLQPLSQHKKKELWDKGLYDDAVLNEMGLKWNADKTVIIKDEQ